jgi:prepilin-type N-terminal cleavage/methylation domain-containing protein
MHKKRAFSLIELLVSMSIISILTVLFLSNYRSANRRTDLIMTSQILVTDIRYAQANALGLTKYNGVTPEGGWGVYFSSIDNDYYIIFADADDSERYDDGEAREDFGGRVIYLPNNIVIEELNLEGTVVSEAHVTFLPPDPITRLRGDSYAGNFLEIKVRETINDTVKTVRINFLGLVEVID